MSVITADCGKDELEWIPVSLSERDSVKGLIRLRQYFDLTQSMEYYTGMQSSTELGDMTENAICVYADLDRMIQKTNFTNRQKEILERHMSGESLNEIAEKDGVLYVGVNKILNDICDLIVETNKREWKKWTQINKLNKPTKVCQACKKEYPKTKEFFLEGREICFECTQLQKEVNKKQKTDEEWNKICLEYQNSKLTQKEIAEKYNVSVRTVGSRYRKWKKSLEEKESKKSFNSL